MKTALLMGVLWPSVALAWFDETHAAVMRAAEAPFSPCLAVTADALVDKLPNEAPNHYVNGTGDGVTEAMVREQVGHYNQPDPLGHLYGAVLAAYRHVQEVMVQHRRPAYAYGYLAHYVGDLSQPLHQMANDAFNKAHHLHVDGMVNDRANLDKEIRQRMMPRTVTNEADVVREIVRLANQSRALGEKMRQSAGALSDEEAFQQLADSASLLRAITGQLGLHEAAQSR